VFSHKNQRRDHRSAAEGELARTAFARQNAMQRTGNATAQVEVFVPIFVTECRFIADIGANLL
jgi:hypothetical protein